MKKNTGKFIIITTISLCLLTLGVTISIYSYNKYNYNKHYTEASDLLNVEKYDEAILNFNKALEYDDASLDKINKQIELAKKLKTSNLFYQEGLNSLKKKDYLNAIEKFKNVIKDDTKRYDLAKEKIKESSDYFIKDNIENAIAEANEQKYESAIKYLDIVLNFDDSNEQAIQLKKQYTDTIKKIEEEKLQKNLEEERLKKLEEEKKSKARTNKKVASTPLFTLKQEGNLIKMTKKGFKYISYANAYYITNSPQPRTQFFRINAPPNCTFEFTVNYENKPVTVTGEIGSEPRYVHVQPGVIPDDGKVTYTLKIHYYGKIYTTTGSFTLESF